MQSHKRILIVEAHPDDAIWGCGGTVAKIGTANSEFRLICFTTCLEDPLNKGILDENREALKLLGVTNIWQFGYPRRFLFQHAQNIRDALSKIKSDFNPTLIFCPSPNDSHQDHKTVGECCKTIFNGAASLLCYEILTSLGDFKPSFFVKLSDEQIKLKIEALRMFKTQYRRPYFKKKIVFANAIFRGTQVKAKYAEAFEAQGWIE